MMTIKKILFFSMTCVVVMPILSRDILMEFKAGYFKPTSTPFKNIYSGGAIFGPEVTFQLVDHYELYGFASVDYFHKDGFSVGLSTPTSITLVPLAVGVKYFFPIWGCNDENDCLEIAAKSCENDCDGEGMVDVDLYVGLGFQPVHVHLNNDSSFVVPSQSNWAYGGIAKAGVYLTFLCGAFIDLFIDYSFARVSFSGTPPPAMPILPVKANINGVIFGGGIGYRF